nr:hypothetical protein [Burkholderia gladioli]
MSTFSVNGLVCSLSVPSVVELAVIACSPSDSASGSFSDQLPLASACVEPAASPSTYTFTSEFARALPITSGCRSSVGWPDCKAPCDTPTWSTTWVIVIASWLVSTVNSCASPCALLLPARSVTVVDRRCGPSASACGKRKVQLPSSPATVEPITLPPSWIVTVAPASARPV